MCSRLPRRASGFTLVELIAVIAIIAILAAYAAPVFVNNTTFSQRGYADELASSLRLARSIAVATSCDVQVTINAGTYQVMQRAAGVAPTPCQPSGSFVTPVRRSDGNTLSGYPPAGVNVPGNSTFTFLGTPPNAGSIAGGVAPPPMAVGTFTVSVDVDGWVQVQ